MRGDNTENARDLEQDLKPLRLVKPVDSTRRTVSEAGGVAASAAALREPPPMPPIKDMEGIEGFRKGDTPPEQGVHKLRGVPAGYGAESQEREQKITARRASLKEARQRAKKAEQKRTYRRRRGVVAGLTVASAIAVALFVLAPSYSSDEDASPISAGAGPKTEIASVGGVGLTTPVRPEALSGLGYHAGGEFMAEITPAGESLSKNPVLGLLPGDSNPDGIRYFMMDSAGRGGSGTGSLDIGAKEGAKVYSPVTGVVTSIRPDPTAEDSNIIEIQPQDNTDLRLSVSLVNSGTGDAGVNSPVEAGETQLGTVVDSAEVLEPQLASYTEDAGNHITLSVVRTG